MHDLFEQLVISKHLLFLSKFGYLFGHRKFQLWRNTFYQVNGMRSKWGRGEIGKKWFLNFLHFRLRLHLQANSRESAVAQFRQSPLGVPICC